MSKYRYQIVENNRAIVVIIIAHIIEVDKLSNEQSSNLVEINTNLSLLYSVTHPYLQGMESKFTEYLSRGLDMVVQHIPNTESKIVVEVTNVIFDWVDYHAGGIVSAMAGWAIQEFELDLPVPKPHWDKNVNRFVFDFTIE